MAAAKEEEEEWDDPDHEAPLLPRYVCLSDPAHAYSLPSYYKHCPHQPTQEMKPGLKGPRGFLHVPFKARNLTVVNGTNE